MKTLLFSILWGCGEKKEDTNAAQVDTQETADSAETEETGIVDTEDTEDSADSGDSLIDTADTADINDTADTGEPQDTGPTDLSVMDFTKPDINTASASVGQDISPRQYLQQISGWYFIKAT